MENGRGTWQQEGRKRALRTVSELMMEYGGYSKIILNDEMPDFEAYVSLTIGCSTKMAKDYIETLRKAAIFHAKHRGASNGGV